MTTDLRITSHAVARYRERVRPALDADRARVELERVVACATVDYEKPNWFWASFHDDSPAAYAHLSDGIAGIVEQGRLVTVVVRGGSSATVRSYRSQRKRKRREARRNRAITYGSGGKREFKVRWR